MEDYEEDGKEKTELEGGGGRTQETGTREF
jgi:hypothetical protein